MATLNARAREEAVVRQLRERYESQGFEFFERPGLDLLPMFLGSYRPDAIALKPDKKVAIEVKTRSFAPGRDPLAQITHLFKGQGDWEFKIILAEDIAEPEILAVAQTGELLRAIEEARQLLRGGHRKAAMIAGWSILEAGARALVQEMFTLPTGSREVVQWLTSEGYIDQSLGQTLRDLIPLRNAAVHGDLSRLVTEQEAETVVDTASMIIEQVVHQHQAGAPA